MTKFRVLASFTALLISANAARADDTATDNLLTQDLTTIEEILEVLSLEHAPVNCTNNGTVTAPVCAGDCPAGQVCQARTAGTSTNRFDCVCIKEAEGKCGSTVRSKYECSYGTCPAGQTCAVASNPRIGDPRCGCL